MQLEKASKVLQALGSYIWDLSEKVNSEGSWSMCSCPLAPWTHQGSGRDYNPSCSVNVEAGVSMCHCYSCGLSAPLSSVIRQVHGHGGIDADTSNQLLLYVENEANRGFTLVENVYTPDLPTFFTEYLSRPHQYIYDRGFTDEDIAKWQLGYSDDVERMLLPFYTSDGTLQAIVGRDVTGQAAMKYMIYPKGFPRSKFLFGEPFLTGEEKTILVVEGYLDAVKASKYVPEGVGVVAIGTAIPSDRQLRKIISLAPEICLGLDNPSTDAAGLKGFNKAYAYLSQRCDVSKLDYRQFKDADEADAKLSVIFEHRDRNLATTALSGLLDDLMKDLTAA